MTHPVTCTACQERSVGAPTYYDVGNPAKPAMGHAMYFVATGRIALCVAPKLAAEAARRAAYVARSAEAAGLMADIRGEW